MVVTRFQKYSTDAERMVKVMIFSVYCFLGHIISFCYYLLYCTYRIYSSKMQTLLKSPPGFFYSKGVVKMLENGSRRLELLYLLIICLEIVSL